MLLAVLAAAAVLMWPAREPVRADVRSPRSHHAPGARERAFPWRADPLALARGWLARLRGRKASANGPAVDDLADLVEILVPPLRAGASAAAAVALAARALGPRYALAGLAADLSRVASRGGSLAAVWAQAARGSRSAELVFLARAWELSERTGVPLATALGTVGRNLRVGQAAERALAAATAGARASMVLLALLPATGPAVGLIFGLTPVDLYGRSPVAALSLAAGAVLAVAGLLWSRAILRRALQPGPVS